MSKKPKPKAATTQTTQIESSPSSSSASPKRAKGKIDPQILELRKKHRAEMNNLIATRNSGARLARLIKQEIPKLSVQDAEKLRDHLDQITTPPLPLTDPEPTMTEAKQAQTRPPAPAEDESSPWPAEMAEI